MKKIFKVLLLFLAILVITSSIVFNLEVSSQQCINYKCHILRLPLYLKVLDFFDRHYNYKYLTRTITVGAKGEEEKVMRLFNWTYKNIKRVPAGFPVIDDHIWHTIVRGYGAKDQFSDIFTTLCNHAGINAFFSNFFSQDKNGDITLSIVKINGRWTVFDPYDGKYFKDSTGKLAKVEDLKLRNDWKICSLEETGIFHPEAQQYSEFFANLPVIGHIELSRASIQSPFNRILFQIKRYLKK